MLSAIGFDDQSAFRASKVGHAPANRLLPPELESAELAIAQAIPELAFSICGVATEPLGVGVNSSDGGHSRGLGEEKPSPNPLP
jgi:hypothetical protein